MADSRNYNHNHNRKQKEVSELRRIPGVGADMEQHLRDIGIEKLADLCGRSPEEMYLLDEQVRGQRSDRCVLYVFRLAVYFAENEVHQPEKLRWWYWKDKEDK